jgi:hypothetical protein
MEEFIIILSHRITPNDERVYNNFIKWIQKYIHGDVLNAINSTLFIQNTATKHQSVLDKDHRT